MKCDLKQLQKPLGQCSDLFMEIQRNYLCVLVMLVSRYETMSHVICLVLKGGHRLTKVSISKKLTHLSKKGINK